MTQGWQPIETAPKDGVWFDIWALLDGKKSQGQRFTGVEILDDGSFFVNGDDEPGPLSPRWKVTHWMPLPNPPKDGE